MTGQLSRRVYRPGPVQHRRRYTARTTLEMHPNCADDPCNHCRRWTPEMLEYLDSRLGKIGLVELTEEMNVRFAAERPVPWTENAIMSTAKNKLGRSEALLDQYELGITSLEHSLGVDHRVIVKRWIAPGFLPARRRPMRDRATGVRKGEWLIDPMDVVRFLYVHTWAYDWRTLNEPWATIGRLAWWLNPVVGRDGLRMLLGYKSTTFLKGRGGVLRYANYLVRYQGTPAQQGSPMFWLRDVPWIKIRIRELGVERQLEAGRRNIARQVRGPDGKLLKGVRP